LLHSNHLCRKTAENWYMRATKLDQDTAWLWILRGENLVKMGQYDLGIECLMNVVSRNLEDADEAYLNIGLAWMARGDYLKGIDAAEKALQINNTYKEAIELLDRLKKVARVKDEIKKMKLS